MQKKPFVTPQQFANQPAQKAAALKQKSLDAKSSARYDAAVKANGGHAPGSVQSTAQMNKARDARGAGVGFGGEPTAKKAPEKTVKNTLRPQKARPNKPTKNVLVPQGTSPSKAAKMKGGRY